MTSIFVYNLSTYHALVRKDVQLIESKERQAKRLSMLQQQCST